VLTLPQSLTDSDVRKLLKPFAVYEITKMDRFQNPQKYKHCKKNRLLTIGWRWKNEASEITKKS